MLCEMACSFHAAGSLGTIMIAMTCSLPGSREARASHAADRRNGSCPLSTHTPKPNRVSERGAEARSHALGDVSRSGSVPASRWIRRAVTGWAATPLGDAPGDGLAAACQLGRFTAPSTAAMSGQAVTNSAGVCDVTDHHTASGHVPWALRKP